MDLTGTGTGNELGKSFDCHENDFTPSLTNHRNLMSARSQQQKQQQQLVQEQGQQQNNFNGL